MASIFFQKHKGKIFGLICAGSFVYLLIHMFVIEKYQYKGFNDLIQQANEHFFHLLPITIAFIIFVIADVKDRFSRKHEKFEETKN